MATTTDADVVAAEQHHHDRARAALAAMRARTSRVIDAGPVAATEVDSQIVEWHLRQRLRSLVDDPNGLFFGRIDGGDGSWYVGRRHIEGDELEVLVVDWRARVAVPFYRATVADPLGLARRRRHSFEEHRVTAVFDEDLDDPEAVGGGGVPDPLLAELERGRTGEMRDIVATIQAEQDEIIRAPLGSLLIVQGGPGTGKTAVGLHRAAFLLYEHRERLERDGVLVVGPNRVFLRYIAQVLPSLGEAAVTQLTVAGLAAPRLRERGVDADDVAALKGDGRMADVIDRLTVLRIRPPSEPVAVPLGTRSVRIEPEMAMEVIDGALASGSPRNDTREGVLRQLASRAVDGRRRRRDDPTDDTLRSRLVASPAWRRAVDRIWPSQSAQALLRELYGNRRVRRAATAGLLTDDEADLLARSPSRRVGDEPWTLPDLVLLDELEHRLNGTSARYGHGVVDEAQDLSAMALRMVARRVPTRSLTVLGDLAQATAPACQVRWEGALHQLGGTGEVRELQLGYRLPAPILDFASRLLPTAAPHVRPSRSVRLDGREPHLTSTVDEALAETTAEVTARLAEAVGTVGVIVPEAAFDDVRLALEAAGLDVAHGGRGLETPVTLVDALTAKGLEFDAVVVVEPAAIAEERLHGLRALYVALTRAVQLLHIVHVRPLPAELAGAGQARIPPSTTNSWPVQ